MKSLAHRIRFLVAAIGLLCLTSNAFPHGAAIDVLVNEQGQLTPFLFASGSPLPSPSEISYFRIADQNYTDAPGLGIVNAANGIAAQTLLEINVAGPLVYWDGANVAATASALTIASPDGIGTYVVTGDTGDQTGVKWAIYPGGAFWESHGFYVLDPIDAAVGLYGLWLEIASPSYETSDPMLVPFLFDPDQQLTISQINLGIAALLDTDTDPMTGDFNHNGMLDAADIDALTAEVARGTHFPSYDVTGDKLVNEQDRVSWVEQIANTYFGDANLDLVFDSEDFVHVLIAGEYVDGINGNSTWGTGDWNGDTEFDSQDFVTALAAGGYNRGPRALPISVAVPEPATLVLAVIGMLGACGRRTAYRDSTPG